MARSRASRIVWIARIHEMRMAKADSGLTYRQMAADLGYKEPRLHHVLGGFQFATPKMVQQVADYFGQDATDLFFCIDLENPDEFLKATAA